MRLAFRHRLFNKRQKEPPSDRWHPSHLRQLINTKKKKKKRALQLLLPSFFRFEFVVNESCRGKLGKTPRKGSRKDPFFASRLVPRFEGSKFLYLYLSSDLTTN